MVTVTRERTQLGTVCVYEMHDHTHWITYQDSSLAAAMEMCQHLLYVAQTSMHPPTRILINASAAPTLNLSAIFRELRTIEKIAPHRSTARIATVLRNTFYIPFIHALLPTVLRADDKFRMFSSLHKAVEWVNADT